MEKERKQQSMSSALAVNVNRSRRLQSGRKSYQLTFYSNSGNGHIKNSHDAGTGKTHHHHQNDDDDDEHDSYYCITETKLASGQRRVVPHKWCVLRSPRQPHHRCPHPPVKSILRVRQYPSNSSRSSVSNSNDNKNNKKSLRFSNKFDRRFYPKGSCSSEQLVKITYYNNHNNTAAAAAAAAGHGTENGSDMETSSSSEDDGSSTTASDRSDDDEDDNGNGEDDNDDCNHTKKKKSIGMEDVIHAVKTGNPVQDIVSLLQQNKHHLGKNNNNSGDDNTIAGLYHHIKQQLQQQPQEPPTSFVLPDKDDARRRYNLKQIQKLLNIYLHAEKLIATARALKQWSRFEINIESILIQTTANSNPLLPPYCQQQGLLYGEVYYSSQQLPQPLKLGSLPVKDLISRGGSTSRNGGNNNIGDDAFLFVDYTSDSKQKGDLHHHHHLLLPHGNRTKPGGTKYCLNHNSSVGLADDKPEFFLRLYHSEYSNASPFVDDEDHQEEERGRCFLGEVRIPCSFFRFLCTQPEKAYGLERELNKGVATHHHHPQDDNSHTIQEDQRPVVTAAAPRSTKVKFSIRKVPLKKGFLRDKRRLVADKLTNVIDWIQRFNKENGGGDGSGRHDHHPCLLSANICAQDNVNLLHAAILIQEPDMVRQLMKMGANPYAPSTCTTMGSAMTLALNMSDRRCNEDDKAVFDTIVKLLQEGHNYISPACTTTTTTTTTRALAPLDSNVGKESHVVPDDGAAKDKHRETRYQGRKVSDSRNGPVGNNNHRRRRQNHRNTNKHGKPKTAASQTISS